MQNTSQPDVNAPSAFGRRGFLKGAAAIGLIPGVLMACTEPPPCDDENGDDIPRSLVCIFMAGGADSFNMFLPNELDTPGSTYSTYAATRGDIAPTQNSLLPVGNGDYAFHGGLPGLRALYEAGNVAVVGNVGPLVRPTTPSDFEAARSIPQMLFAHDAQQQLWQTGASSVGGANVGWGAQIGSRIAGCDPSATVAPSISIAGSNLWQTSATDPYLRLHPTRSLARLGGYDPTVRSWIPSTGSQVAAMDTILTDAAMGSHPLVSLASQSIRRSYNTTIALEDVTSNTAENEVAMGGYGNNGLAAQLHQVARLINARDRLGQSRQVFFVQMGGWDTHSDQNERFPPLLSELDEAISQFQYALGPDGMDLADSVTTFTASDFGRTLTTNGNGTDHAWGGHSFVIGGDVKGGQIYGRLPNFSTTNNPDVLADRNGFSGRVIPKLSVNQLGATLARWCGVQESQLPEMFPDLSNFPLTDLNFFRDPDTAG